MEKSFTKFSKITLAKNAKTPINKWSDEANHHKELPNMKKYNVGVLTGQVNNLLVLDIDVKDDGLEAWKEYFNEFGEPKTLKVSTPSGGYHYYFKYASNKQLNNKTKYRGVGIDIRSNGGYVVAPPSKINDVEYKIVDGNDIIEMPTELIKWLLNSPSKQTATPRTVTQKYDVKPSQYQYLITDDEIMELLSKLSDKYLNNYSDWLLITTILKSLDKFDIWVNWCQDGKKFDYYNNLKLWDSNEGGIDINYLIKQLKKEGHNLQLVKKYKPYEPLTKNIKCKRVEMNEPFVYDKACENKQYTYKMFTKYDTSIIKSITGTGKTTAISKHVQRFMKENQQTKLLSITARQSLSSQHVLSFKNIGMRSYLDKNVDMYDENALTICINSLCKLRGLTDEDMKNYIIYIDEISSFLELTHNDTLDGVLKEVYHLLIRFMKHSKKVVVSDALINDGVLEFLKHRNKETTIYLENHFKKYEGVKAIRVRDENNLLIKLLKHCRDNKYFLFGCDSCETITKYYNKCLSEAKATDRHKYILITADSSFSLYDANEQFKDKFVFYSPKITYGVDFNVDDTQDVFIYIKGNSIQPSGCFQQATRCRNINKLYFYGEASTHEAMYDSLDEVKKQYKEHIKTNKAITNISTCLDENDDIKVLENSFFNIYCYNEYVKDIYQTNKEKHFELILESNGFIITEEGQPKQLNKEQQEEMKSLVEECNDELFDEYIKAEERSLVKYDIINNCLQLLCLTDASNETLQLYKDIITNKNKLTEHLSIIRMLKSDEYIDKKLFNISNANFNVKTLSNTYNKLKLLRTIEKTYGIEPLDVACDKEGDISMSDEMFNLLKTLFRTSKSKPTTYYELRKMYVGIIKHMTCNELVTAKQNKKRLEGKRDAIEYTLNKELIEYHLELNKYMNGKKCFHDKFIEMFNIDVQVMNDSDKVEFINDNSDDKQMDTDDDDDYNVYCPDPNGLDYGLC